MGKKNFNKSEFEIVSEVSNKLGLPNQTDGTIVRYSGVKFTKPDGVYSYKDIIIILDAKAEGHKFTGQLESYLVGEKKLNPRKQIFGIKYNGAEHYVYLNSIDNLLPDAKILADKEYYYNIAHSKELDKTEIYTKTRAINNILHSMGLSSLLDRMV
jgi:hypothetical protein